MRQLFLCLLVCSLGIMTGAQTIRRPLNAAYLGNCAYSTVQYDPLSFAANQGVLAFAKQAVAGVYGERRFMLADNSWYTAAAVLPTAQGNFAARLGYGGATNFGEQQASLAYARMLGKKAGLGLQLNYYSYRAGGLGSAGTVTAELGLLLQLTDQLRWGMQVYNPVGGRMPKTGERLPAVYSVGLGYDVSDQFYAGVEFIKEALQPVNVQAGCQYQFAKRFFLRGGVATATRSGYAGAGLAWQQFRLDISGAYHPQLGWSPGMMLLLQLNKKEAAHEKAD